MRLILASFGIIFPFYNKNKANPFEIQEGSQLDSYSHSIVPQGFGVRSKRTLLTPSTSFVMRSVMC